jgi:hypothetical protein
MDKLQMTITLKVEGKEGLELILKYTDTDMKTVLLVEKTLVGAMVGLLAGQNGSN